MGAWDTYYKQGTSGSANSPLGHGVRAVKKELQYNGYNDPTIQDTTTFGSAAAKNSREFQKFAGITVDGVVGPQTARHLFGKRCAILEESHGIPERYVFRVASLESGFDPAAVGVVDPNDHGLVQINALAHPEVTYSEAFDPEFSLAYLAEVLSNVHSKLNDWPGAVVSWNVGGGGASDWVGMHHPATGGPPWFPDLYARATKYYSLVMGQSI